MSSDYQQQKELAMLWKRAAPRLRAQRHADIRRQNNARAIESFDSFFKQMIKKKRPSKTSGFVQMYETLKRQSRD